MQLSKSWLCVVSVVAAGVIVGGCSASGESDIGVTQQALPPPAGANAAYVSDTLPGTWAPDERRVVTVTMNNTGTTTWTPTGTIYRLGSLVSPTTWTWGYTNVSSSVAPGNNHTFSFIVTAPSAVVSTPTLFSSRMETKTTDPFGATQSAMQTVDPAATPLWGCTLIADDVPLTMTPGERRAVHLTLQNTGSATWPAGNLYVESRDTPAKLWDQSRNAMPSGTVAPGASAVATVTITAPTTPGTYAFTRELLDLNTGAVGLFRTRTPHCVTKSIDVQGATQLDADHISNTLPTMMVADDVATVSVTMRNTGAETWAAAGSNYVLFSQNSPSALWTATSTPVTVDTSNGVDAVFTFQIRAPATPGSYAHRWQMRKLTGTGAAYFGDLLNVPVTVVAGTTNYSAAVTSQTIPLLMTAGTTQSFSITMQNDGGTAWTGSGFQLYSTNSPVTLWGAGAVQHALGSMETVAVGASRVFTFNVTAPAAAGTYTSSWRMRQSPGIGFFGATASTPNIVVTLCGNNVINGGEECDDGNLVAGDACSTTCQWEQTEIDFAVTTPDRGIVGSLGDGQLAAVTIGDVTGDGTPEVLVSQRHAPTATGTRSGAGGIYAISAGGGFFTDTVTSITASPLFRVSGAAVNDALGLVAGGRIVVGEVTGDAVNDLIVSAPGADATAVGPRAEAGEVYVIAGGAGLTGNLLIDLGAMTPPTQMVARIYGGTAGDALAVLAAGDITGDGVGDLVLGAPNNASLTGAIHIVVGPVSGTIDLNAAPGNVYTIAGGAAGDSLGTNAAIGDFGGSAANDLLLGVPKAAPGGLERRGTAYGFFGPIGASTTVGAADVTWLGPGIRTGFGTNVAIGNVTGSAANEAVISGAQLRSGAVQHGGVTVWSGVVAGTVDMSAGGTPTMFVVGPDQNDECGTGLQLGRVNADTYDDIVFTCSLADGPTDPSDLQVGEMHMIIGATTLPASYDLTMRPSQLVAYGAEQRDRIGRYIVALAVGDLDGDTRADMCVGSYLGGGATDPGQINCVQAP